MTPLQLEILLHYSYSAVDFNNGDFSAPAVREAIDQFKGMDELLEVDGRAQRCYRLTERGRIYVNALLSLPLPVRMWRMPPRREAEAVEAGVRG